MDATPNDSNAGTEVESVDDSETPDVEGKKIKKKGLGKAGAARRRKAGMKK